MMTWSLHIIKKLLLDGLPFNIHPRAFRKCVVGLGKKKRKDWKLLQEKKEVVFKKKKPRMRSLRTCAQNTSTKNSYYYFFLNHLRISRITLFKPKLFCIQYLFFGSSIVLSRFLSLYTLLYKKIFPFFVDCVLKSNNLKCTRQQKRSEWVSNFIMTSSHYHYTKRNKKPSETLWNC